MHKIVKVMLFYKVEDIILVNGAAGPVLDLKVLIPSPGAQHPADASNLVAMCTKSKTYIASLNPMPPVIRFKHPKPQNAREGTIPYLAWRRTHAQGMLLIERDVVAYGERYHV